MASVRLSQKEVERAMCPSGRKDRLLFDRDMPGFGIRVGANGVKTFIAQYTAAGKKRRIALGAFGVLTVEEARKAARSVLGDAAKGADPFADRKARRNEAKAAAAADAFTFGRLVDAWQAAREGDRRAAYLVIAGAAMRRHFAGWIDRPAGSIAVAEAVRQLDRIKADAGPVAANRVLAYGRAACGWALKRQMLAGNPFAGIEAPSREKSRDRVLTSDELGAIWRATNQLAPSYSGWARVLLLTLARRDEVASMRWAELSSDMAIWTLPAARAKNGRAHVVHLAEAVRSILAVQPRVRDVEHVFAAASGRPISAFSAAKRKLDRVILEERRAADPDAIPPAAWTIHDFRRAGVTALAGMGFAPHVCDRLLNHTTGAIQGVAAVYQRHEFLAERRSALDAWAAHVIAAAEGRQASGNVIALRA